MNKLFGLTVIFCAVSFSGVIAMEPGRDRRPSSSHPHSLARHQVDARRAQLDADLVRQRRERQEAQDPRHINNPNVRRRLVFPGNG